MVTIMALWLPILLSAVLVWIVSAIVWMVLPHHKSDFKALPEEEATRDVLKPQNLAPGQFNIPHMSTMKEMQDPENQKKFEEGPVAFLTVLPRGVPSMSKSIFLSLVYYVVVSIFVAYMTGRTQSMDASYFAIFRVAGTAAWLAYGFGVIQDGIWFGRPWSSVVKHLIDSFVYALVTAGAFGGFWPR